MKTDFAEISGAPMQNTFRTESNSCLCRCDALPMQAATLCLP